MHYSVLLECNLWGTQSHGINRVHLSGASVWARICRQYNVHVVNQTPAQYGVECGNSHFKIK